MNMNSAIRAFNNEMVPLGVHSQKINNKQFIVALIANGKGSYIKVFHEPSNRTATLATGFTDPAHRGKGVGAALRAQAMRILYTSGYKKVTHLGLNIENIAPGNYPVSTKIVRGRLGFKINPNRPHEPVNAPKKGHGFYYSVWTPSTNTIRQLANAIVYGKSKLTNFKTGKNLSFNGNVRKYIKKK